VPSPPLFFFFPEIEDGSAVEGPTRWWSFYFLVGVFFFFLLSPPNRAAGEEGEALFEQPLFFPLFLRGLISVWLAFSSSSFV